MPEIAADYMKHMVSKPKLDEATVVRSPMPGLVRSLAVKEGDQVCPIIKKCKCDFFLFF